MASTAASSAAKPIQRTASGFPVSKLLIIERLKKGQFTRTDVDSRQPLVRSLDETDRLPRKLHVHLHSVVFAVFSALAYVFDFVTDIIVGASQFQKCRPIEGSLILIFAFLPSLFVNTLGFLWVMDDLKRRPQNRVTNRLKKPVWIFGILTQTVPALYSLESAYYYCKFRQLMTASNGVIDAMILELYYWILESDRDSTILRVFISFLESAPQLLIQACVLGRHLLVDNNDSNSLYAWFHYVSIASSLLGLSWSLMSQHRCLRYIRQDKENVGIGHCIMIFVWRTLTLIGRFIALLVFTLAFSYYLALLLLIHYLLILVALVFFEQPKLAESKLQQILLILGVAWVHLFCPWNVEEGRTRIRYVWRYGLELVELVVIIICLYYAPTESRISEMVIFIITAACCYLVGLLIMVSYYSSCHPNKTRGRRPYPPLVVVYTPPEKAAISVPDSTVQPSVVRRRQDSSDGDCCGCLGGGLSGRETGGGVAMHGPVIIHNTSHDYYDSGGHNYDSGGGGGGCDGGWGSTGGGGGGSVRCTDTGGGNTGGFDGGAGGGECGGPSYGGGFDGGGGGGDCGGGGGGDCGGGGDGGGGGGGGND